MLIANFEFLRKTLLADKREMTKITCSHNKKQRLQI